MYFPINMNALWWLLADSGHRVFYMNISDHLYGLVARVPGYRSREPGFSSWHY
jgi:hypothetical protein